MLRSAFLEFQDKEIARIQRMVAQGLDIRKLLGASSDQIFGFRRQLKMRVLTIMERTRNFARSQVQDELGRQAE